MVFVVELGLGAGLLLSVALFPQATEGACSACSGAGRIACEEHRSSELARETNALVCSFYSGCKRCEGRGTLDCPACDPPEDHVRRELLKACAARFAKAEATVGRPVLAAASAHFDLVCELEPAKVQGKKKSKHELLHLYLDRMEEVQRDYLAFFATTADQITSRSEMYLWSAKADHEKLGQELCGYTTPDVEYKRGIAAISSIWVDPRKLKDDEALHRHVVHHVVHGLMNAQPPVAWTGKMNMGWADEGLSLWFEDRLLGAATGFCFWPMEEPAAQLRSGILRPALRKLLEPGNTLELEGLLMLDTVDMTREQQALGFGLVDYLATRDAALLKRLLERMRARTPSRDAFKEVYGLSLEELEAAWRAWVMETYPAR